MDDKMQEFIASGKSLCPSPSTAHIHVDSNTYGVGKNIIDFDDVSCVRRDQRWHHDELKKLPEQLTSTGIKVF